MTIPLKSLVPLFVVRAYQDYRRKREDERNAKRTPKEVFSEIYRKKKWGGTGPYCSGDGSSNDSIVGPYVATVGAFLRTYGMERPRVVDLGCGDFSVGSQLSADCSSYVGVDVVPELVKHLQDTRGGGDVHFECLDMVDDPLPDGDICLIRQVLQHLSNQQIAKVVAKLGGYRVVLITEHHPHDGPAVVPNLDKVQGGAIRLYRNSGVYLDRPPFNVPSSSLTLMLEVPGHGFGGLYDAGVIRTFRLEPQA